MATIIEELCDFCGGPKALPINETDSNDHFTVKIMKRLAKKRIGITRFLCSYIYDMGTTTTTIKYDMCSKCYLLLVDICKMNTHLPTEHFKAKRDQS